MKFLGGLQLLLVFIAGLQFTLAQNVTDCTDISAGLETSPIDPVTGEITYIIFCVV